MDRVSLLTHTIKTYDAIDENQMVSISMVLDNEIQKLRVIKANMHLLSANHTLDNMLAESINKQKHLIKEVMDNLSEVCAKLFFKNLLPDPFTECLNKLWEELANRYSTEIEAFYECSNIDEQLADIQKRNIYCFSELAVAYFIKRSRSKKITIAFVSNEKIINIKINRTHIDIGKEKQLVPVNELKAVVGRLLLLNGYFLGLTDWTIGASFGVPVGV